MRNPLKVAAALVGAAAISFGLSAPAMAAGAAEIPGTEANTYVSETQTLTDAGGHKFTAKVLWTETYVTAAGNIRVGVKVYINAQDTDLDIDGPGDGGQDVIVKTYQGYSTAPTKLIQTKNLDGASDPVTVDNANPLNRPGKSKVEVAAGVNDDGKANSPFATFVQPVIGNEDPGADGEGTEGP